MSTERLYYADCYTSEFEARIVDSADVGRRVYLDRTAFYPTSGGQPNDLGTLGNQPVVDVIEDNDRIAHILAAPLTEESVRGAVDWSRRYDHMQQHTGQHLLSAVFVEFLDIPTLSFHLGAGVSTIELETKDLREAQIDAVEERANRIVAEARPVNIVFEHADAAENLRKPSARTGVLRIVEIEGLDRSACGGTHVRSTAEVGPIQMRKSEKVRNHLRIEFVCGLRALRRTKQDFRVLTGLARELSAPADGLPEHVASLRQRLLDTEKDRHKMALELARRDGEALYQATPLSGGMRRALLHVPVIDDLMRAKAQAFTAGSNALLLAFAADPPGVLLATSADSGVNAGAVMKQVLSQTGARGGGSFTLAQGSISNPATEHALAAELGFSAS
ncbi:MAG: alanyl-tRNA editing protein [Acidobacteriaceae bacterium]|nr:alanyl-tRNA editing protein [Acidobacteriaceae bacterium]